MGYFSSLLRQTGIGGRRAGAARGTVAPIDVHEMRLVTPEPQAAGEIPAHALTPAAVFEPQTPTAVPPRSIGEPTRFQPAAAPQRSAREHYALEVVPDGQPLSSAIEAIEETIAAPAPSQGEAPPAVRVIEAEPAVVPARAPELPSAAVRSASPRPAAVTFEEVRRWVAAPLLESAAGEPERAAARLQPPAPASSRWEQAPARTAPREYATEPRTENVTLSIGSIQVIVEEPAPPPAAAQPQPPAQPQPSTASPFDATRLARSYVTF